MVKIPRRGPLGQLGRYQRLAMFGGGLITTLIVLLAFVLHTTSTIRAHIADEREAVLVGKGLLSREIEASEASVRTGVHSAELIWADRMLARPELVKRFHDNGAELLLQPTPRQRSQLVVGTPGDPPSREELARYLGLSEQLSRVSAANSMMHGRVLNGYYYSVKRDLITLVPAPEPRDPRVRTVLSDRSRLIDALSGDLGDLVKNPTNAVGSSRRPVLWAQPFINPVTNKREFRLAATAIDDNRPFAVFVTEYPDDILTAPLSVDQYDGTFMIVSKDGALISTAARHKPDQSLIDSVLRATHAYASLRYGAERYHSKVFMISVPLPDTGWDLIYHDKVFMISAPLSDTGWDLIYAFSWSDIARAVAWPVGTAAAMVLAILVVLWTCIFLFHRRVFVPLLDRSQRVFESERLNRTLVETVPVGLAVISSKDANPLLRSPFMLDMVSRVKVDARSLSAAFVDRYAEHQAGKSRIADKLKSSVMNVDLTLPLRDGGYVELAVSAVPARYRGEDVLVTAFSDVTTKKQLEQQLRDAKQAADLANAAKSAFLAAMSHEIRTPLNAILGNLELLARSPLNPIQQDRLETIRTSSESLLGIISDVLDISKIEAGEMILEAIDFDLVEMAERSLMIFSPLARVKGLSLYCEFLCTSAQNMVGDPTRFGQIVNNLLSNAIKFTEIGKVTLRLAIDPPSVEHGRTVVVVVEDTGIGMSPAQCRAVFRPFSQADSAINRRFGGAGLGLALCRHFVEAMGGKIEVSSELHVGSSFAVRLPLDSTRVTAEEPRLFEGESVIVLTASEEWNDFAVPHLQAWGLEVHVRRHPMLVTDDELATAGALLIYSDQDVWRASEENRLVEEATHIIDIRHDGPAQPLHTGKVVCVSCYSLRGLERAVRETLFGDKAGGECNGDESSEADTQRGISRQLRVLVAEDNPANRKLFAEQLETLGCDAHVVASGREAIGLLAEGEWDLLLTDLNMPDMSGYELARAVRARYAALPIFAVTAHATIEERIRCEAIGMSRVLIKPLSLEQLFRALVVIADAKEVAVAELPKDTALSILGGKPIPEHLRKTFVESCLASFATIYARKAAGDGLGIVAELHSMRGALGIFGQKPLAELCGEIEERVKVKGSAGLGESFAEFESAVCGLFEE